MSDSTANTGATGNDANGTAPNTDPNGAPGNDAAKSIDSLPEEYSWAAKEIRDARNEAKNLRERVKAAEPAAQRLAELEAASKTDAEKAAERLATAEKSVTDLSAENLRLRVAVEKGVPADMIDRLRGKDEDEMRADADALMARFKPADEKPAKPAPDKSQGNGSAATGDPAQLFGSLFS